MRTRRISQTLPSVTTFCSQESKSRTLGENKKHEKTLVQPSSSVLRVYIEKNKTAFKNWIKRLKPCMTHKDEYFEVIR